MNKRAFITTNSSNSLIKFSKQFNTVSKKQVTNDLLTEKALSSEWSAKLKDMGKFLRNLVISKCDNAVAEESFVNIIDNVQNLAIEQKIEIKKTDKLSIFTSEELKSGFKEIQCTDYSASEDLYFKWSYAGQYDQHTCCLREELNIQRCQEWANADYSTSGVKIDSGYWILSVNTLDYFTTTSLKSYQISKTPKQLGADATFIPTWNWKIFQKTGQARPNCTSLERAPNKYTNFSPWVFETEMADTRPIDKFNNFFLGFVAFDNDMLQYSKKIIRLLDIFFCQKSKLKLFGLTHVSLYESKITGVINHLFSDVEIFSLNKSIEWINTFYKYIFHKRDFINYHIRNLSRHTILRCKIKVFSLLHQSAFLKTVKVHIFGFRKCDHVYGLIAEVRASWEMVIPEHRICKKECTCKQLDLFKIYPTDNWILIRKNKGMSWKHFFLFWYEPGQKKKIACCRRLRFEFSTQLSGRIKSKCCLNSVYPLNFQLDETLQVMIGCNPSNSLNNLETCIVNFGLLEFNYTKGNKPSFINTPLWLIIWVISNSKKLNAPANEFLLYSAAKKLQPLNFRKFFFFDRLAHLRNLEIFILLQRNLELELYLTVFFGVCVHQIYIESARIIPRGVSKLIFLKLHNVNWRYFGLPYITRFIRMLIVCIACKNTHLISLFIRQKLNTVHFKQHKQYFRFFFRLFRDVIWPFRKHFKLKGIFLQFRGKLAKGGDARKKVLTYRAGTTALIRKDLCIQVRRWAVWSRSGAIGCVLHIYY